MHRVAVPSILKRHWRGNDMDQIELETVSKDKLIGDLKVVLSDAEELLRAAAAATGERAAELREKAAVTLKRASEKIADVQEMVLERGKAAARVTDDFVHDNPWRAVGIAAGAGFLLGLLVNRR
jgi:ElaB/YqjD/DUF883 family membrane-anchored ribosome-binding protein